LSVPIVSIASKNTIMKSADDEVISADDEVIFVIYSQYRNTNLWNSF